MMTRYINQKDLSFYSPTQLGQFIKWWFYMASKKTELWSINMFDPVKKKLVQEIKTPQKAVPEFRSFISMI